MPGYRQTVTHDGETHTIDEWATLRGMAPATLYARIKRGWPVARALAQAIEPQTWQQPLGKRRRSPLGQYE
jgi:hypothetical protein